jgi:hypothetical protein
LQAIKSCKLFVWDDEIEGHPPYIRDTRRQTINSNNAPTQSGKECCCKCSELLLEISTIVKELQCKQGEKMKIKLLKERKTSKIFKMFFLSIILIAYGKMFL